MMENDNQQNNCVTGNRNEAGFGSVESTTSSNSDSEAICGGASLMRNVKREKSLSTIVYEGTEGTGKMQTMTISADSNHIAETTELQLNNSNNRMSSDDDEHGDLQKEYETLMEENQKLKNQTQKKDLLKRKISMLRKENETLKSAQEQQLRENLKPDSSEPNSQPNHSSSPRESTSKSDKEQGVFAKSFLLTSTLGGIYIEPIDGSNGIKVPDGNSLSPTSFNNIISSSSPTSSYVYKPDKTTSTTETQTLSTFHPPATSSAKSVYHYSPRVKVATTEEDEEAHRFVQEFKARRIALKLTQSDIGEELNLRAGARYGQSYISRMESIQLSTAIVLRMKPLLLKLLEEKEDERRRMKQSMDFDEEEYHIDRKRKKRTNFTPEQSLLLTKYFADQPRPSPQEIDDIARKIDVDRNSVKMWFNNKRQSEKFRGTSLPGIGSINSVGSLNPYASPYAAMPSSFLMSGLMSNMAQNAMNPIVTTSSLNNLKLDYNLSSKIPSTTLSLENVNLATTQAPFVFNKDLNQLYTAETAARINNAVNNNLKKDCPTSKMNDNNAGQPFSLASQTSNPFIFNKELTSLYQNNSHDHHKVSNDLAQLYKERVSEAHANGNFTLPSSPPTTMHSMQRTIKSISPPSSTPAFSLSQSLINRTLSQAAMSQESNTTSSPKFSRSP
ncbi:POU domain, class 2, transcription factor 2-like isoform X2 [Bolinopsis microptera]|uniref:POU domain, class 2, transcription factor 2-like isoform X2 n=1 Tax=Bolinopsis microptera TaxID=2820187 RepID=UPI0030792EFE